MIEIKIQIYEQYGGIRIKGHAENINGPSTILENEYTEKFLPRTYNASKEVDKEMGFTGTIEFEPFNMIRRDSNAR